MLVISGNGIEDAEADNEIRVYPNPANDWLSIYGNSLGRIQVQIFDLSGRLMLQANHTNSINISSLHSGLYILKFFDNLEMTQYSKFMKE